MSMVAALVTLPAGTVLASSLWAAAAVALGMGALFLGKEASPCLHVAVAQASVSSEIAAERCREALLSAGARIVRFDRNAGVIQARRGPRVDGPDQIVHVEIREVSGGVTVTVACDLTWPTAFIDWGANRRLVDRLLARVLEPLPRER